MLRVGTLLLVISSSLTSYAEDWLQWRGPSGQNYAAPHASAPTSWSESTGTNWICKIPGRGHSSPTIVSDRIYLTTCEEQEENQSLLVINKQTGKLIKKTITHRGKLPNRIHPNNSYASPTVASDSKHVFALFNNDSACWITKYDLDGQQIWQKRVAPFDPQDFQFGFGSSPILVDGLLVIATEYDGSGSGLYAIDAGTGDLVWRAPRSKNLSYSTPIPAVLDGRKQLIMSGDNRIASYDPATGRELWQTTCSTYATCGTMVWDSKRNLAFASGGNPDMFTLAIQGNKPHAVLWETKKIKCYEQSMLLVDDYLYAVADNGIAHCLRAEDGNSMWTKRLGGRFSASPILVNDTIYITNEQGTTFVFRANPDEFDFAAENQLGDECFATTTPVDGKLYHRYAKREDGLRQEYLAAIGE